MDDFGVNLKINQKNNKNECDFNINKVENKDINITHSIMNKISLSELKEN
jgi:hypothetical protein